MEMAGHQRCTSPGRPTSPSGERVGRASLAGTTSAPGGRTAPTPTAAHGSLGMSLLFTSLYLSFDAFTQKQNTIEHRRRSLPGSGTRSPRTDTTSAETGSWSVLWPVAVGKDITFGGVLKSSGVRGSSSPAARVRRPFVALCLANLKMD
jgi:hypothetical protein